MAAAIGSSTALAFIAVTAGCLPSANATMTSVHARPSDALADSFGIKVVTSQTSNTYGDHTKVMQALQALGVRHIRTDFFANNQFQVSYLNQLRSQLGITSLLVMGRPDGSSGSMSQLVSDASTKVPGAAFGFEGANEWDRIGGSNWAPEVRSWQQKLYSAVKSNSVLKSKPVYGPAMGGDSDYAQLGNVSSWEDYGNLHTYPGGLPPSNSLSMRLSRSSPNNPGRPMVSTETGYHDLIPTTNGHRPASDTASALYYPRLLLEDIHWGFGHSFAFELMEESNRAIYPYRLGLVRYDWSRKPAFNALANIIHLAADPGPSFTPGSLSYGIQNAPSDLQTQLYQKRDGTFMLYLWRDVSVWDPNKYVTLSVPSAKITVTLPKVSRVSIYRPTSSANAQTTTTVSSVPVSIAGEVVALAIK